MTKANFEMNLMQEVQRYRLCNHCSVERGLAVAMEVLVKNGAAPVRRRKLYSKSEVLESMRRPRRRFARWMTDNLLRRA